MDKIPQRCTRCGSDITKAGFVVSRVINEISGKPNVKPVEFICLECEKKDNEEVGN